MGDLGTDSECEREESESSGVGLPAWAEEALGLTDCWCEGVGPEAWAEVG